MKKKDLKAALAALSTDNQLDSEKVYAASPETIKNIVMGMVGQRWPVPMLLVEHPGSPQGTLTGMGYFHPRNLNGVTHLCTADLTVAIDARNAAPRRAPAAPFKVIKGKLTGYYPGRGQYDETGYAEGFIGHNEEAKANFKKDSLAYLRTVQKELGWVSCTKKKGADFRAGGVAVSGDAVAYLKPEGGELQVHIVVNGDGHSSFDHNASRSGVSLRWEVKGTDGRTLTGWKAEAWDTTAQRLAELIAAAYAQLS